MAAFNSYAPEFSVKTSPFVCFEIFVRCDVRSYVSLSKFLHCTKYIRFSCRIYPFRHIRLYIKLFFDAKSSCNTWPLSTHTHLNSPLKRRLSFISKYLFVATYGRTSHSQNFCTARNSSVFPVKFSHSATSALTQKMTATAVKNWCG